MCVASALQVKKKSRRDNIIFYRIIVICYIPYALGIVALNDTAVGFEWQLMDQSQTSDLARGPTGFNSNTVGWYSLIWKKLILVSTL
jgi:hypothetical protein